MPSVELTYVLGVGNTLRSISMLAIRDLSTVGACAVRAERQQHTSFVALLLKFLALVLTTVVSMQASAKCASDTYGVEGSVMSNHGARLEGVALELRWHERIGGEHTAETISDAEGGYSFQVEFYLFNGALEGAGRYRCDAKLLRGTIVVSADGYESLEVPVYFVNQHAYEIIKLVRKESAE